VCVFVKVSIRVSHRAHHREIEDWTVEGMLTKVLPAYMLTTVQENCVQCARAEAEFVRWNEWIELKHAEIY
jgi:hypothetical protein